MDGITLDMALKMCEVGQKHAENVTHMPSAIAVVDASGVLKTLYRMEGPMRVTAELAANKARSSALLNLPTSLLNLLFHPLGPAANFQTAIRTPLLPVQGAVPVRVGFTCIGAIGASGGTAKDDEDVAKAGMAAMYE